jgi:hypothetical protein
MARFILTLLAVLFMAAPMFATAGDHCPPGSERHPNLCTEAGTANVSRLEPSTTGEVATVVTESESESVGPVLWGDPAVLATDTGTFLCESVSMDCEIVVETDAADAGDTDTCAATMTAVFLAFCK